MVTGYWQHGKQVEDGEYDEQGEHYEHDEHR
jgi:hypothetical protein